MRSNVELVDLSTTPTVPTVAAARRCSRSSPLRVVATAAVALATALSVPAASAQSIADGTKVRIQATGLSGGWLDGKVQMNKSSGCTMVYLDRKQPGGYTMVALNSVGRMERQEGGAWVDVPVKPLLAKEKKSCREAAND